MHRKAVIFTLSFLTISAYPLHRDTREATLTDSKSNQAHDKTNLTKDVDNLYKSHLDSSSLYNQEDDHNTNPMAEEMQRKLIMESERLRTRLRQELAELQERLSPSPAHLSSPLASMRELLAPLTQQLHSSISSNTQELCGQLSLYLQDLDTADAQTEASSADRHQEAFHLMTQALDRSSSKLANVITDLHSKTAEVIGRFTEITANEEDAARSDVWQVLSSRLGQEASSLRVETQIMVGALKEELAALLETSEPSRAEVTASVERFCQKAASVSQVFQIQMEKLFQELEEQRSSSLSPSSSSSSSSSSSTHPAGSLQEDFSVKLSALIHDIVHSVVTDP